MIISDANLEQREGMARGKKIETIIELFCKAKNFPKYRNNLTLFCIIKAGKSSDHVTFFIFLEYIKILICLIKRRGSNLHLRK